MIRFRLKELLAEKEFRERRVITLIEVASCSGVHRTTLSRIANDPGYSATTAVLDRLCEYFRCPVGDLVEHVPDDGLDRAGLLLAPDLPLCSSDA
jgi:DNA-binding Xre family transcriptional regulator